MTKKQLFSLMGLLASLLAGLLAGLLAIASVALAQNAPSFEALDTNKDGRISVLEAKKDGRVAGRFAAADTNQDGYLDQGEFSAAFR